MHHGFRLWSVMCRSKSRLITELSSPVMFTKTFNRSLCTQLDDSNIRMTIDENESQSSCAQVTKNSQVIVQIVSEKTEDSFNEDKAVSLVEFLLKCRVPPRLIVDGLTSNPELITYSVDAWDKAINTLLNYGFKNTQLVQIITAHNQLLHGSNQQFFSIGETLRHIGFHDGALQKLICRDPSLLTVTSESIVNKFNQLCQTFQRKEIIKLATENPNVLYEDFAVIERKMMYVHEEMGIDFKDMTRCDILTHDYLHIKTRHQFVARAGIFQKQDIKDKKKVTTNHSLTQIVSYDNKRFAKKVANMSLEEVETFQKMFIIEEAKKTEEEEKTSRTVYGEEDDDEDDFVFREGK